MGFMIRTSRAADLGAIDTLLARSYPKLLKADYPPSVLVTALPRLSRAQPALVGCGTYYVAEERGKILGAGGWTPDRQRQGLGHIRHLVTDHRAVRRGIGRALVNHALGTARAAGMREMECWSTRTAEPFYAALGFVAEGPLEVTLAPGIQFPAVRMRLRL
ncbi:GNAT family N-acetyltransferase [Roseobacteraceae bacterium NS-SX3]